MNFVEDANVEVQVQKRQCARSVRHAAIVAVAFHKWIKVLNAGERAVLMYLWAASPADGVISAGYRLIGGALGMDWRNVRRGMKGLIEKGLVRMEHRGRSKADRSQWRLLSPRPYTEPTVVKVTTDHVQQSSGVVLNSRQCDDAVQSMSTDATRSSGSRGRSQRLTA